MSKYIMHAEFEWEALSAKEREEWLAEMLLSFPDVTEATLELEAEHIGVSELSSEHVGSGVRLYTGTDHEVAGTLDGVFQADGGGVTLIINGRSYAVGSYELAEIVPPVTVGEKTADEPEEEDDVDPYAGLSGKDIQDAIASELEARILENPTEVASGAGLLFRSQVESIAGEEISGEDFRVLAVLLRNDLSAILAPALGPIIRDHLTALRVHQHNQA